MTYIEFNKLKVEVVELIEYMFQQMKTKDYKSYALFLASAYKNELYLRIPPHVPFATEYGYEQYIDETRNSFLSEYLKGYEERLRHPDKISCYSVSYDINLQMMIYTHIWESKLFLKRMDRIANILANNGYIWDIAFVCKNRSGREVEIKKGQLIKNTILPLLKKSDVRLYDFLSSCYDSNLRNSFAHSMFMIDENSNEINTIEGAFDGFDKSIDFEQWEVLFIKIALFNFHLSHVLESCREELMKEIAESKLHYIPYSFDYTDYDNPSASVRLKLGLSNQRGYSEFQFYKDK